MGLLWQWMLQSIDTKGPVTVLLLLHAAGRNGQLFHTCARWVGEIGGFGGRTGEGISRSEVALAAGAHPKSYPFNTPELSLDLRQLHNWQAAEETHKWPEGLHRGK